MTSVTINGHTYTDDSDPDTGLAGGGHRIRFVPALQDVVAVAATVSTNATTATTKANEAATSATTASTKAGEASVSAVTATTKAGEAAASATTATTKANEAATSADEAEQSATTATTKANEAAASATTTTTKAGEAAASATTATTKAGEAAASAIAAGQSEINAGQSATTATTKAGEAATSATTATTKAGEAAASALEAQSAAAQSRGIIWVNSAHVGGTANAITLSPTTPITAYAAGLTLEFILKATNSGAVQINISGVGQVNLNGPDGAPLQAGELTIGYLVRIVHNGTSFLLAQSRVPESASPDLSNVTNADFLAKATSAGLGTSSVEQSSPTYVPSGSSTTLTGQSVLAVYEQIAGQTFDLTYNVEADYAQEDAAKTDLTGGAFTLANTGGAVIDTNTKLLIHADGVNGSTEIVDSRGITPFGAESCGWFDGSSYYTVPKSEKLAFGTSTNFTYEGWFRVSEFTGYNFVFDCRDSGSPEARISLYVNAASKCLVAFGNGNVMVSSALNSLVAGSWYHWAVVRNSGVYSMYLNGVNVGQNTGLSSLAILGSRILLGGTPEAGSVPFFGWQSNFRVSKVARYTGAFTPPTAPFVTDEHTVYLFKFNDGHGSQMLRDESKSGHEVALNNNAVISNAQAKFGTTSLKTTTGNAVVAATKPHAELILGTNDFTIDYHFYKISNQGSFMFWFGTSVHDYGLGLVNLSNGKIGVRIPGATATYLYNVEIDLVVSTGAWHHAAVTRSGSNIYVFIDGTLVGTYNVGTIALYQSNGSVMIGKNPYNAGGEIGIDGYFDEFRVKLGVAEWTANFTPPTAPYVTDDRTVLLLHFEGANGDKVTLDSSESGYAGAGFGETAVPALAFMGGAALSSTHTRGGHGTSLLLATSSQCARLVGAASGAGHPLYFNTGEYFCLEGWFFITANNNTGYLFAVTGPAGGEDRFRVAYQYSSITLNISGSNAGSLSGSIVGSWSHVALVREARGWFMYKNGVGGLIAGHDRVFNNLSAVMLTIGGGGYDGGSVAGAIDSFRITHGKPRYTENFTPGNLTADADTSLLWVFDGSVGQKWVKELSKNTATIAATNARTVRDGRWIAPVLTGNNIYINTTQAKFGSSSLYFNGTSGNYLRAKHTSEIFPNTGYTIEAWVRPAPASIGSRMTIFNKQASAGDGVSLYINASGKLVCEHIREGVGTISGLTSSTTIPTTGWTWVSLTSYPNNLEMRINGVVEASATGTPGYLTNTADILIGETWGSGGYPFNGYMDEFRVSGTARWGWTQTATIPTLPYGQQYVTGPAWVATKPGATALDLSTFDGIDHASFAGSVPPGTTLKFLASFDGYASPLKRWDGSAWVATAYSMTWSGGTLSTTATAAQLDGVANSWLEFQTGLAAWTSAQGTAVNIVAVLATSSQQFTPSLDGVSVTMEEYTMLQPVADYTVKRKKANGVQTLTFTRVKSGNANHVFDYITG